MNELDKALEQVMLEWTSKEALMEKIKELEKKLLEANEKLSYENLH